MLQHSFIHLPGIGEQTEQRLWAQGVRTWDELADSIEEVFSAKRANAIMVAIEESRAAFDAREWRYFQDRLKGAQMWRLAPECLESAAYLDIETTGLGFPPMSHSTTIAVSFKGELFVEHEREAKRRLLEKLTEEAGMFVTFNGLSFDMPFLRREFDVELAQPHIDLRVWFRHLGYKGGLKKIQKEFPEVHQRSSMDIDGFDAVRLWRMHKRGVPGALETLMTYNAEDAVVLQPLLHLALARECARHLHLPLREPPPCQVPEIATQVHHHVYGLLRGEEEWQVPRDW